MANERCLSNVRFLPLGEMLRARITTEWNKIGTHMDHNIKLHAISDQANANTTSFIDKYKEITKEMDVNSIPLFGMTEMQKVKKPQAHYLLTGSAGDDKCVQVELTPNGMELIGHYVVPEAKSLEYFHNVQRFRKLWWMKYASNVGRFSLSEVRDEKIRNLKVKTVWLMANYNFGTLPLESIKLMSGSCFQTKTVTNKNEPVLLNKIVRTSFALDVAALGRHKYGNRYFGHSA